MPHEAAVRAWLARVRVAPEDIEDMIQEAYCRLAALDSIDHIDRADGYFFSVVRHLHLRRIARAKVVPLVSIADFEDLSDDSPSPERAAASRLDYARMTELIATLPERRRRIFELRKIDGRSQREIAMLMGVSENIVEHEIKLGMVHLQKAWRRAARAAADRLATLDSGLERRA